MLVIFCDWQGVIHNEFVSEDETINAVYYTGIMERLLNRIRPVIPYMRDEVTGEWRKLHNEELNDLYSLPNIVRVVSKTGHV
jgi:hypothetical protein